MQTAHKIALAALAVGSITSPAFAQGHPKENYVCTAEQAFGPLLGRILPVTISKEQAPFFGLDPAECQTPVGQF